MLNWQIKNLFFVFLILDSLSPFISFNSFRANHLSFPANICLFKVNHRTIETLKQSLKYVQSHWHHSGVFIINSEHISISDLFLVFLLLNLDN